MGQTLTHGVYLPDKGERNCYNGLAANWSILDGAVGTVAEHTTQIAGKAPLVHTHTKSDITDFPAYGNTAGTICEGNDSRLSDARTPVAHTHTKSDVTDLFNSANTWTGEQTFQAQSIYQVNSDPRYVYKSSILEIGVQPTGSHTATSYWLDKNNNELGFTRFVEYDNSAQTYEIRLSNKAANGALAPTGNDIATNIQLALTPDGVSKLNLNVNTLRPVSNGVSDLGDSTRKWKTLNGVNPGALSLPNGNAQDATWSGDLTVKDGSDYNLKTFTLNGWVTINIPNTAGNLIVVNNGCGQIVTNEAKGTTGNNCSVTLPVVANVQISVLLVLQSGESVKNAIFAPCLGNV